MARYKNLLAYKKAYELAMKIFHLTKIFPVEERYSLIDQIQRSSRSVCTNLSEACKRTRSKDYFLSKLNDSDTENNETEVWLDFSYDCKYLSKSQHEELSALNNEVGR